MIKWVKRLGLVLAGFLLIPLALMVYVAVRVASYEQAGDEAHLAAKQAYLEALAQSAQARPRDGRPNVLLVFYDDLGLGDLGFAGSDAIKTPVMDALAADGLVMTRFYASAPVCSPSRAALLTGRLPPRAGVPAVVYPSGLRLALINRISHRNNRIPTEEITLADMLSADGYRTGMVGKWHLGDEGGSLPTDMGFGSYFGVLYSNDMTPLALYRDKEVAHAAPIDQTKLDGRYTDEAIGFIEQGGDAPFFLYFAHNFPHIPLYVAPERAGVSDAGLYGDVVEALDTSLGRIVDALKQSGQYENTIIILTSDNGPWFQGSPGGMRGRKGETFEGGMRVPFFIHWPGHVAPGQVSDAPAMNADITPTLMDWLGLPPPPDRVLDGQSMAALIEGRTARTREHVYYYGSERLYAVSDGRFKYRDRRPVVYTLDAVGLGTPFTKGPWLFDLSHDPDESYDVSMRYPDVAARLKTVLEARQAEDQANLRGWVEE